MASRPCRKRYGHYDRCGKLKNRVASDERPAIVESRCRIGLPVACLFQADKAEAAVEGMETLQAKILTITLDNGLEFAGHEVIAKRLGADIYFAHP